METTNGTIAMETTSFVITTICLEDNAVVSTGHWEVEEEHRLATIAETISKHLEKLGTNNVRTFINTITE